MPPNPSNRTISITQVLIATSLVLLAINSFLPNSQGNPDIKIETISKQIKDISEQIKEIEVVVTQKTQLLKEKDSEMAQLKQKILLLTRENAKLCRESQSLHSLKATHAKIQKYENFVEESRQRLIKVSQDTGIYSLSVRPDSKNSEAPQNTDRALDYVRFQKYHDEYTNAVNNLNTLKSSPVIEEMYERVE